MRKLCLISTLLLMFSYSGNAQVPNNNIEVGETLTIQSSQNYQYSFIDFPKPNFIIKKGGIANYGKLKGTEVVVTEIKNKGTENIIVLKRKDGKKFFGSFPSVTANLEKALRSRELTR